MDTDEEFLKYLICALIEELKDNVKDIEKEMKSVGYPLARMALEVEEFSRDNDIQSLLYKITYVFLEKIYATERRLEISKTSNSEYYIYEYEPMYTKHISLTESWTDFCPESIITGVIEYVLKASGFECVVTGYVKPSTKYPDLVIYHIKLDS